MKKCLIYYRVSTKQQGEDGVSLSAQAQKGRDWAQSHGYTVIGEYQDIASGSKNDRQGMELAVKQACKEKATLVCYSLSRLSRSVIKSIELINQLSKCGAAFVSLTENELETVTPQGMFLVNIHSALAQMEIMLLSQRTKTALRHLRIQGFNIYSKIPYGWDLDSSGKMLVKHEAEQAIIARIVQMKKAGLSLGKIANQLNKEAIPTKQGKQWGRGTIYALTQREMKAETVAA